MRLVEALESVDESSVVVQVTGSRDWRDERVVWAYLDGLHAGECGPVTHLVSGMATGLDSIAARWALSRNVRLVRFPAEWNRLGRKAGPVRNQEMAAWSKQAQRKGASVHVAAWMNVGSRGTAHMVRVCRSFRLSVTVMGPGAGEVGA